MSLFQCGHCGCCENTALASQGCDGYAETFFDWAGFEDRKGKKLCSACAPTKHSDGSPTEFGAWHGRFTRVFLPMGLFRTARNGNLEHIETGDQEFRKFALATPKARTQAPALSDERLSLLYGLVEWCMQRGRDEDDPVYFERARAILATPEARTLPEPQPHSVDPAGLSSAPSSGGSSNPGA